jgi:hypothetical protein
VAGAPYEPDCVCVEVDDEPPEEAPGDVPDGLEPVAAVVPVFPVAVVDPALPVFANGVDDGDVPEDVPDPDTTWFGVLPGAVVGLGVGVVFGGGVGVLPTGVAVGTGVGFGVGTGVGLGVGTGVGLGVGAGH